MLGRTLSHYFVEKRLGAGGMGEVFLARDLALGRMAALKVLSSEIASEARARLLREGEASARLQHPAIATFFEAGESDGVAFLAMEFVEGETLRDRLRRGPLPFPEALSVAASLLEALVHAHAAGVLHRDIKPENIMVTGGNLGKLLDFGIARLLLVEEEDAEAPTEAALTGAGGVVGTIGYMSPEQLRGEPLDERTDLFSIGAVLYEALTGGAAFPGKTAAERIAAALSRDPAPLRLDGIPAEMSSVISRALERDSAKRYRSAASLLSDLRAVSSGEFVAALPDSLAIVDFQNLSAFSEDDWIGSGIAESLGADLSGLEGLHLVGREKVLRERSSQAAAGKDTDALEVGRLLGCRWVLSGAFQRIGAQLRLTSRLMEVSTGEVVATEKLDGAVDEIFAMQDRLSSSTADRLRPGGVRRAARVAAPVDAYERYARGRRLFLQLEKGSFDQARHFYEQAIGADPGYAPALAGLAAVCAMRYVFTTDSHDLEAAVAYSHRSIAADPGLAEPRIWLGYALFRQGQFRDALEQERMALELDPSSPYAAYFCGIVLALPGNYGDALPVLQRAVELDPGHAWAWVALGWTNLELGLAAEAGWCFEQSVKIERLHAGHPIAGSAGLLAECLRRGGDLDGARANCLEGLAAVEKSDNKYRDTMRGICLCALGRTALAQEDDAAARAAFDQAVTQLRGRPHTLGGGQLLVQALAGLARALQALGPLDEALELFRSRRGYNFDLMWTCTDDVTLLELSRGAAAVGRTAEAAELLARALAAGSREAREAAGT